MPTDLIIDTPVIVDASGIRRGHFAVLAERTPAGRMKVLGVEALGAVHEQCAGSPQRLSARAISWRPVNAHTHLDLTTHPRYKGAFPGFVAMLVAEHRERPAARGVPAASAGLKQLLDQRVGAIGDIVARDDVMAAELRNSPLPGVAYRELVCADQALASATNAAIDTAVSAWRKLERLGGPCLGFAPQSPYLLCREVLQHVARRSMADGIPLQIHLAESPGELEFFRSGGGELGQRLANGLFRRPVTPESLGFVADPSLTPMRYLAETGFLEASPTLVHCVGVSDEDIRIAAQHRCAMITCPRSNAHLSCGVFPWRRVADAGIPIGLGTDSSASAHGLDLAAEVRSCLERYGDQIDLAEVIRWLTVGGRQALGLPVRAIEAGCHLDELHCVDLRAQRPPSAPEA